MTVREKASTTNTTTILLVDDDATVREALAGPQAA